MKSFKNYYGCGREILNAWGGGESIPYDGRHLRLRAKGVPLSGCRLKKGRPSRAEVQKRVGKIVI